MTFKDENIKDIIDSVNNLNESFKWYPNHPSYFNKPIKVKFGYDENEQRISDKSKLDTIENINKLLSHKVINVNKNELELILDCKAFFEHNNTLGIQLDSNGTYWIKFDDKEEK